MKYRWELKNYIILTSLFDHCMFDFLWTNLKFHDYLSYKCCIAKLITCQDLCLVVFNTHQILGSTSYEKYNEVTYKV